MTSLSDTQVKTLLRWLESDETTIARLRHYAADIDAEGYYTTANVMRHAADAFERLLLEQRRRDVCWEWRVLGLHIVLRRPRFWRVSGLGFVNFIRAE